MNIFRYNLLLILLFSACNGGQARPSQITLTPTSAASRATAAIPPTEAPVKTANSVPPSNLFRIGWGDWTPYKSELNPEQYQKLPEDTAFPEYRIELKINSDLQSISGKEEVYYTNTTGSALDELVFRMYPAIFGSIVSITNTQINGQRTLATFSGYDSVIRFPLENTLQTSERVVASLDFTYKMPADPSGNYLIFAYTKDLLTLAHFYPILAKYDAAGWRTEIPSQLGDVLYSDAAFYLVRIIAPSTAELIESGSEISSKKVFNSQTIEAAAGPARDFYVAAANHLKKISQVSDGITINSYGPAGDDYGNRLTLETAADALKIYSGLVGPYPYTEFDVVATATQALGVEYPGVIAINQKLFNVQSTADDQAARDMLDSTVAHEVGHQWFYNAVGDDQINEPWLDESLTQYITYLYNLARYGASGGTGFLQSLYARWDRTQREEKPIGLPVDRYTPDDYGSIVYGRGPLFFYTLQQQMGEAKMDAFLKAYYSKYQWQIVHSADIQSSLEAACSCDLKQQFKDWVEPN
jgi:hypothetical protein